MKALTSIQLGASLFIPAAFNSLNAVVNEAKYPELKSLVIDFEDGLNERDLELAEKNLQTTLSNFTSSAAFIFIRPRDTKHLKKLLKFDGIEKITGFVLAKFSLLNAAEYLELLSQTQHYIMPSIEGGELFEQSKLLKLREILLANKQKVLLVRFGLEDMLKALRLQRNCEDSIFDFSATSYVLGGFIAAFKSVGFDISGGVYPCFKDEDGFIRDVKRDLKEGLTSKTIIHPSQIKLTNRLYRVSQKELSEAEEIVLSENVVFAQEGKMAEKTTMITRATEILLRAKVYGVSE